MTVTVRLGAVWAEDALGRDLDIGSVIRSTKTTVTLSMTAAQAAEAASAAAHDVWLGAEGASGDSYLDDPARRLAAAAKRVLAALAAVSGGCCAREDLTGRSYPSMRIEAIRCRNCQTEYARIKLDPEEVTS